MGQTIQPIQKPLLRLEVELMFKMFINNLELNKRLSLKLQSENNTFIVTDMSRYGY